MITDYREEMDHLEGYDVQIALVQDYKGRAHLVNDKKKNSIASSAQNFLCEFEGVTSLA